MSKRRFHTGKATLLVDEALQGRCFFTNIETFGALRSLNPPLKVSTKVADFEMDSRKCVKNVVFKQDFSNLLLVKDRGNN
jgi:hypothetical protein